MKNIMDQYEERKTSDFVKTIEESIAVFNDDDDE